MSTARTGETSRLPLLSALALCTVLIAALWRERTGGGLAYLSDLLASAAITAAAVVIAWLLARRLTPDHDRRGLVALIAGVWLLAFNTFQIIAAAYLPVFRNTVVAAAVWTVVCALFVVLLARGQGSRGFISRVLLIAALFLLGKDGVRAASALAAERNGRAPAVARPDGSAKPDVYIIVLDKYSSGSWLRHSYGFDQGPFEDSLRAQGFVVPRYARANYAHTQLALASFLNSSYLDTHPGDVPLSWPQMGELIRTAGAWHDFRRLGYRTYAFPTTFPGTRSFPNADVEVQPPGVKASRGPMTLFVNSPFARVSNACIAVLCLSRNLGPTPYPIETFEEVEWKLGALVTLADSSGPVFAFLHLLVPHEPYLFAENCRAASPWWPLGDRNAYFERAQAAYITQVRCLAPMILSTVREIVARSAIPPVIVLQADHGHGWIALDPLRGFTLTAAELPPERLGDRMGVFAAYLFPGADTLVRDDISPVNVLPLVRASVTATEPELQPDRSFWSTYQDAFNFIEVPAELTRPRSGSISR